MIGLVPSREWLTRLLLLGFSLLVMLVAAEVLLRVLQIGKPLVPPPAPAGTSFFAYHPRLGWDLVPGARERDTSDEFAVWVEIDRAGLRSTHEVPLTRTPGRPRVVVLGDSFTFGHGVENHEAWPALLGNRFPALEVVNLAVTGYGTDQNLLRFLDRGLAYQPDLVLLGLFEGSVFRNARTDQLGYPKPRFELADNGELALVNVPVPRLDALPRVPEGFSSRLFSLVNRTRRDLGEHLGGGPAWPLTAAILARLKATCQPAGKPRIPLAVIIIPKDQAVDGWGPRRYIHEQTLAKIHGLLTDLQLEFLDLTPVLRAHTVRAPAEQALYFSRDGHWTPAGQRVASEAIAAWAEERWPDVFSPGDRGL